jgi:hypothetical protein
MEPVYLIHEWWHWCLWGIVVLITLVWQIEGNRRNK